MEISREKKRKIKERGDLEKLTLFSFIIARWLVEIKRKTSRQRIRRDHGQWIPPDDLIGKLWYEADKAVTHLLSLDLLEGNPTIVSQVKSFIEDELVFTDPDSLFLEKIRQAAKYLCTDDHFEKSFKHLLERSIHPYFAPLVEDIRKKNVCIKSILRGDMAKSSEMPDDLREEANQMVVSIVSSYKGKYSKGEGGDDFFCTFKTVNYAIIASIKLLRWGRKREFNTKSDGESRFVTFRMGIHKGEVLGKEPRTPTYQHNYVIAKRVSNLIEGDDGRLYLTREANEMISIPAIRREVSGRVDVRCHDGPFNVKGAYDIPNVWEILWYDGQEPLPPGTKS